MVADIKQNELKCRDQYIKNFKIKHKEICNVLESFPTVKFDDRKRTAKLSEKSTSESDTARTDKYTLVLVLSNFLLHITTKIRVLPRKPENIINVVVDRNIIFPLSVNP